MRHAVFLMLALVAACGGSTTAPAPTLTGSWSGAVGAQALNLSLVDASGSVTGSGTITNTGSGTLALTVTGGFANGVASLTLASGLHPAVSLHGVVQGATMAVTLTGSGFNGDTLTMRRD